MRIVLVLAGPYPALRGSQVLVQQVATGLERRGNTVHLVTYGRRDVRRQGPSIERVGRDLWLTVCLWRTVRRERIDVIHAHNYEAAIAGLLVARVTGRPLVYHGHNALAEELPTYFTRPRTRRIARTVGGLLDAQVPRRADFCIAVSEALGDMLRQRGVPEGELACIHPVGDPSELDPVPPTDGSTGLVCYAGNLDRYQNLDFLLRSFVRVRADVPRARLVLVTHAAADTETVRSCCEIPGVEVVCAGSYGEARARLDEADVAVSPREERSGFPMKLLNYMAAGKAIVACAGSAKGLRDGVTGWVVPDGDEVAFAKAVGTLLQDRGARVRLGAAARRAIESTTAWESVLDRLETIYRTVTSVSWRARRQRMSAVACSE